MKKDVIENKNSDNVFKLILELICTFFEWFLLMIFHFRYVLLFLLIGGILGYVILAYGTFFFIVVVIPIMIFICLALSFVL